MSLRKTLTKSRMFGFMAVLICIGFVLIFLAACNEEPIDTVWDGNYIYSGLYKCKTNGEDEEVLVNELSVDGKTYTYRRRRKQASLFYEIFDTGRHTRGVVLRNRIRG